jgi:hypothetical protein
VNWARSNFGVREPAYSLFCALGHQEIAEATGPGSLNTSPYWTSSMSAMGFSTIQAQSKVRNSLGFPSAWRSLARVWMRLWSVA